jgi:hypothetical protein
LVFKKNINFKSAQNGHFEVVNELLNAGANPYVFDDDVNFKNFVNGKFKKKKKFKNFIFKGFTPIDYLHKYKLDNETSLTPEDLESYQKAFDTMLRKIKGNYWAFITIF